MVEASRPKSPGMSSEDEVKKFRGSFMMDGKPMTRTLIQKSTNNKWKKRLLCGYCGEKIKGYLCESCSKRKPSCQEDGTTEHEEILDAWKDGEYVTNVVGLNFTPEASYHEPRGDTNPYSITNPSMSQVTIDPSLSWNYDALDDVPFGHGGGGSLLEGGGSTVNDVNITPRSDHSDGILSLRKLKYQHPTIQDSAEWNAALLLGWRSHQKRLRTSGKHCC